MVRKIQSSGNLEEKMSVFSNKELSLKIISISCMSPLQGLQQQMLVVRMVAGFSCLICACYGVMLMLLVFSNDGSPISSRMTSLQSFQWSKNTIYLFKMNALGQRKRMRTPTTTCNRSYFIGETLLQLSGDVPES